MFVRKSTILRRMSGPSKIVGVLPVISGPVDKVDLRHLGLKSHSQGLQKILLRNELEKFWSVKSSTLFWICFKFHPEAMRTLSLGSFAIFGQNYILNIQIQFVINNQNI